MWLLDADSLQLVFFANEDQTPRYAILSHTWSDNELSFQDIMSLRTGANFVGHTGWSKIQNACRLALSYQLRYIWIDTCCIDKSSSAELQEAINSMFRWYELAKICFAYLSDVSASEDMHIMESSFRCSRWFKRGWTLQELIAPSEVSFYDKDWKPVSTRKRIAELIGDITGIRKFFLDDQERHDGNGGICNMLSTASVAQRMSWMDGRETTRPEDLAYCLLGIFDINMPMLYGEGPKAFQRLQEEIMKRSDDSTLLSWDYEDPYSCWEFQQDSLLAPNPSSFRGCRDLEPCYLDGFNAASFSMNQKGLQMEVPVRVDPTHPLVVYMILGCSPRSEKKYYFERREFGHIKESHKYFVAIPLISTSAYSVLTPDQETQKGEYSRPRWCRPVLVSGEFLPRAQSTSIIIRRPSGQFCKFVQLPLSITVPPVPIEQGFTVLGIYPPQPIGDRLILVSPLVVSAQDSPDVAAFIPLRRERERRRRLKIYSKELQIMIHTRVQPFGNFIVVLGHRAMAEQHRFLDELMLKCYDINCRVFKTTHSCDVEDLQKLSITQDFTDLQEVSRLSQKDRYMFNIGIGVEGYLVVEVANYDTWREAEDISISFTCTPGNCNEQEEGGKAYILPRELQAYAYDSENDSFRSEVSGDEVHGKEHEDSSDFE